MKVRTATIILSLSWLNYAIAAPYQVDSNNDFEPDEFFGGITIDWVVDKVVEGAGNAIKNGTKSALLDGIFGSGSPNYVHLSQESLEQIEAIVQAGFDQLVHDEMIGELEALELSMKSYSDQLSTQGERNTNLLSLMEHHSNLLYTNTAFKSSRPYYSELTIQYSLASALRYAVIADKVHYGENSSLFLQTQGAQMATSVEAMASVAEQDISDNVFLSSYKNTICIIARLGPNTSEPKTKICYDYTVTDRYENKVYYYNFKDHGGANANMAKNKLNNLTEQYRTTLKGEHYDEVIENLKQEY